MLRRATSQALRVHDGEDLPGGEGLPGGGGLPGGEGLADGEYLQDWDDLGDCAESSPMHTRPRLQLAFRWRRHLRGAGVGIVLAIPAMLIAHALVAKPSGSAGSQLLPGATGTSTPAIVASTPAAPKTMVKPRSSSLDSRRGLTGTDRRGSSTHAHRRALGAAPVRVAIATVAASPVYPAGSPVSSVAYQPSASERGSASTTEFGFER